MSYLAIYRKYRPKNFDEVSGQKIVVEILKNAIRNNKLAHAYLFAGSRGTGKTSIAKILARTINCDMHGTNPCEECASCLNSASKECVDIIEIDAASNNGVNEIRELKSKINIVPSFLKYKIYIIDEVHMLSDGAFNALLKTLEEPPSHVIFILATTELQKIPSTILSRCQILEFKKISAFDMEKRIKEICKLENIKITEKGIKEIIDFSEGCMRDALSLLEKVSSYTEQEITDEDVRKICGKVSKKDIEKIVQLILEKNIDELLNQINLLYLKDFELLYIVEDVIKYLENMIFSSKNINKEIINVMENFIDIYDKMKKTSVSNKIVLEVELVQKMMIQEQNSSQEMLHRNTTTIVSEENKVSLLNKPIINNENININAKFDYENFKNIRINNTFVNASKEMLNNIKEAWNKLKESAFDKNNGALICNLIDGIPVAANNDYIIISFPYDSIANMINEEYKNVENIIDEYIKIKKYIVALSEDEWKIKRGEYIKNLNNSITYQLLADEYIKQDNTKKDEKIIDSENTVINNTLEEKAHELFDSDIIKIE